jgi:hypothetical protein
MSSEFKRDITPKRQFASKHKIYESLPAPAELSSVSMERSMIDILLHVTERFRRSRRADQESPTQGSVMWNESVTWFCAGGYNTVPILGITGTRNRIRRTIYCFAQLAVATFTVVPSASGA